MLSDFKYIDRGRKSTMVLIPGWATDYRIFDSLNLDFNYLVPLDFLPFDFEEALLGAVKSANIGKVSLFGWSLGGFLAAEFASKHKDIVDKLILVSIRKSYPSEELTKIEDRLKTNRKGYLYKFYSSCLPERYEFARFKNTLLRYYCQKMDSNYLLTTLDYFKHAFINPDLLKNIENIKIIHGEDDHIAPIEEAVEIGNCLPHAEFMCIKNAGHMPFLKEEITRCL